MIRLSSLTNTFLKPEYETEEVGGNVTTVLGEYLRAFAPWKLVLSFRFNKGKLSLSYLMNKSSDLECDFPVILFAAVSLGTHDVRSLCLQRLE
jgi:hypothetical protein